MPSPSRYYSSTAAKTTLLNSISAISSSLELAAASNLPAQYPYTLILEKDTANEEIIEVTGLVGTAYQITRNIDNSGAKSHAVGALVEHGVSARDFTETRAHEVASNAHNVTGDVVGTGGAQTLTDKTLTSPIIGGVPVITGLSSVGMSTSSATPKSYVDAIIGSATAASTSAASAATSAASALTSQTSAATSASSALTSQTSAATSASSALTSQSSAATSASSALTSQTSAATSASSAATSASSSLTSANSAAASATTAAASVATIATYTTTATNSAAQAATSAASAATSASSAFTYASTMAASVTSAGVSASSAATSASSAATSAASSLTSANIAISSAATAVSSAATAVSSAATAVTSAATAISSAATAVTSAGQAATSAASAATSASSAAGSATTASASAATATTSAATAVSSAATAVSSAATATTSAAQAATSATSAANSASSASTSATNAATSATAAATSAASAAASATAAAGYVVPSQTGNAGKYLKTDGAAVSWSLVDGLPSQTGNADKYLKTDGTTSSWSAVAPGEQLHKSDTTSVVFTKTGNGTLSIKAGTVITVNNQNVIKITSSTAVSMPTLTAGTDYFVYVDTAGAISAVAATGALPNPVASPPANSMLIGGFHYAPGGNATAQSGGNTTPQINEYSMWDLKWRPTALDPRGMTLVADKFWSDIYLLNRNPDVYGTSKYNTGIANGEDDSTTAAIKPAKFGGDGTTRYALMNWFNTVECLAAYGKELPTYQMFSQLAYGTTEQSAVASYQSTTGLIAAYTSKWGVMQSTGVSEIWARDLAGYVWNSGGEDTGGRGGPYNLSTGGLLGGSYTLGYASGSRRVAYGPPIFISADFISGRGVCGHTFSA